MIRTPLRPLARILQARQKGENPDVIERENLRLRHEQMRDKARARAEVRLLILGLAFFSAFTIIGARMGLLASTEPAVARELAAIFPEMDAADLERRFTDGRRFMWLRRTLSPEQMQAVHEIGDPGLLFGPREMRLYPNGPIAAHVLGAASFGAEGVHSAEVIGTAGIEKKLDARLRDPAQAGTPLALSLDLTVQATVEEVLDVGMQMMNAKGAAAIVMEVKTGEIIAMASLPDYDPNHRPNPVLPRDAEPGDSPVFNRAVQGVYELGSTFKVFATAQAMELGLVGPETMVDADAPMVWGRHRIREFQNKNYGPLLSVTDVIVKSSNVGTARLALEIGGLRQQAFLKSLGFFDPVPVELIEAPTGRPLLPKRWADIVTITTSYGHGMSASPLHLAAAYATIANGGLKVTPTLLRQDNPRPGPRVMREEVAHASVDMLRQVVTRGTASLAEVPGYEVAGKTGTADKPRRTGGYYDDKVINTFASLFPASDPKYVVLVTLDEPVDTTGPEPRRTAGWTAVPVTAEIIRRIAPLLDIRPKVEAAPLTAVSAVRNDG
ncbi:MAG: penicillin-binding protein 2 [Cypionkella sp.]|nr:penicillin-binding protein 2 [Cypionkella sp.]